MIFIALNHKGQPISIVNAKSRELAVAYWRGTGDLLHYIRSDKDYNCNENSTGVVPILETVEIEVCTLRSDASILTIL